MATVLLMIKSTITAEEEEAFNRWYDNDHIPQVMSCPGTVSARRYKTLLSNDQYQYMALYEFDSEETFEAFQKSDHLAAMSAEYDALFGNVRRDVGHAEAEQRGSEEAETVHNVNVLRGDYPAQVEPVGRYVELDVDARGCCAGLVLPNDADGQLLFVERDLQHAPVRSGQDESSIFVEFRRGAGE